MKFHLSEQECVDMVDAHLGERIPKSHRGADVTMRIRAGHDGLYVELSTPEEQSDESWWPGWLPW